MKRVNTRAIEIVTSVEAGRVCRKMAMIYLKLLNAPAEYLESGNVLRFERREVAGEWVTAWESLIDYLGVGSGAARRALKWMSEKGLIGYDVRRKRVSIPILINDLSRLNEKQKRLSPRGFKMIRSLPFDSDSTVEPRTNKFRKSKGRTDWCRS